MEDSFLSGQQRGWWAEWNEGWLLQMQMQMQMQMQQKIAMIVTKNVCQSCKLAHLKFKVTKNHMMTALPNKELPVNQKKPVSKEMPANQEKPDNKELPVNLEKPVSKEQPFIKKNGSLRKGVVQIEDPPAKDSLCILL